MKWAHKLLISLSVAFFVVCFGAILLFDGSAFGWQALSVPTGSMRPTIPPGSLVLMHRVPLSSLKVGDVITYISPLNVHKTITHRITKLTPIDNGRVPAFITKGDANPSRDPNVVIGGQVIGKIAWHVPYLGKAMLWSKTWPGIIVLIYLPALLVMIEEVRRLSDYWRKFLPYQSFEYLSRFPAKSKTHVMPAALVSLAIVASSALIALPAQALLRSNTVTLGPNHLTVAAVTPPPPNCSTNSTTIINNGTGGGTTNNNVSVSNSNNQTATSGNASSSGNTNGGSATSGNATNTNCTSTTITITNH